MLKYCSCVTTKPIALTARMKDFVVVRKRCIQIMGGTQYGTMYMQYVFTQRFIYIADEQLCSVTSSCSHYCQNTPEGFTCYCPKGLHLQPDSLTCLESHPCNSWGVCSQHCIPLRNRHKCKCEDDYQLQSDGFTCKSKGNVIVFFSTSYILCVFRNLNFCSISDSAIPQVIFSNRHELRGVDLHTLSVKALISSLKSAVALDFYHTETTNMIYWTDVVDDKIYRGTLLGECKLEYKELFCFNRYFSVLRNCITFL